MYCNKIIHKELLNMGENYCPFCDIKVMEVETKQLKECCQNQDLIDDNHEMVCKNCGIVQGYN